METQATGATWHTDAEMRSAGEDAPDQSMTAADRATDKGMQLTQQAQQQAGQLAGQAREQLVHQLAHQKDKATSGLDSMARAIRQTGQQMQDQGQAPIAQVADRAATQVERVSAFLSQRDINALREEAERFARRQTPLFLAGAFALGWLGARFLKSSAPPNGTSRTYAPGGNPSASYAPPS